MKIQFKGKMTSIERHSTDAVLVKFSRTLGTVIEGDEKLAPEAKKSQMSMEFVLRPAVADTLRIGQTLTITVDTDTATEES
jgi:hypothetical protein